MHNREKLKYNGTQGKIKINKNVDRFEIPVEDVEVETSTVANTTKNSTSKPKKSTKFSKRAKIYKLRNGSGYGGYGT